MSTRYKLIQTVTWITALVLSGIVISRLPLATINHSIAGLSLFDWSFWVCLNVAIIYLYGYRWLILNRMLGFNPGINRLLLIRQAGQALSFLTPGPQFGGEPFQVYWLYKICSIKPDTAVIAVSVDRFYELWLNFSILVLGVVVLIYSPEFNHTDWKNILFLLLAILSFLTFSGWILINRSDRVSMLISRLTDRWKSNRYVSAMNTHWDRISFQLKGIIENKWRYLVSAFAVSLLGWVGMIAELVLLLSFLDVSLELHGFVFLLVSMRVALLLPLPGGIGSLEASVFWVITVLGLPASAALGLLALIRLRDVLVLLVGIISLYKMKQASESGMGNSEGISV